MWRPQHFYETNFWSKSGNGLNWGFHRGFHENIQKLNICEPRVCGNFNQILDPETYFVCWILHNCKKEFFGFMKFDSKFLDSGPWAIIKQFFILPVPLPVEPPIARLFVTVAFSKQFFVRSPNLTRLKCKV